MVESFLKVLGAALSIWDHKERNKYYDEWRDLQKRWYEESNKQRPDMATLDNLRFRLCILGESYSNATKSDTRD